ncbi:MAG: winged helix DNA-binding domain-containing protein [Rhodococcus sp. (in: high G+C Gram-positive bacteria)]|uniref:winged helix DNA-binding domain-containing protein n=1 Tax=Rhodococcus sp. TaxID=1831 RepID=UPI002ADABE55|nr:winged helix DNA-binding domain-containing protein [Rhodococcus sp. (in: high G+C Gram-positive bacteria)]
MSSATSLTQVANFRWHRHQLDTPLAGDADHHDCDILDLGIQNTGPDGAAWALQIRGVRVDATDLALAWTLRGAPHYYRRRDLPAVAVATSPFSEADAAKRIYDANRPLKAAGIPTLTALQTVATAMRDIVSKPTVKGEMSAQLTTRVTEPYLRFCRPCNATHLYEMPFRLAALQAGLELQPGTSPPVLERIPGWRRRPYTATGSDADPRFDVIRGYLRFYGPATPAHVASFLDAPVKDVRAHWPTDAEEIEVNGEKRWILEQDREDLLGCPTDSSTRLLGPFDPYVQLRDRETLVPDPAVQKTVWPTLGRPGTVMVGGTITGLWRPRASGKKLKVAVTPWGTWSRSARAAVAEQAEILAEFRGVELSELVEVS